MTQPMLFSPLEIRSVRLKNRVVVAPMHQYSGVRGFPTSWHLMNAGRFAAGGAGLVFIESTKIERRGCGTIGDLGLWDDAFVTHVLAERASEGAVGAWVRARLEEHALRRLRAGVRAEAHPWEGHLPADVLFRHHEVGRADA